MEDKDKTKKQHEEELNKLRKRVAELEKSESDRHNISPEFLPDGYLRVDLKGKITDCNSAFLNLTGYSREDIVNKHFTKLPTIQLKEIPRYIKMFNSARRGKLPKSLEFKWIHKDETTHWGESHIGIIRTKRKISGINVALRDITERKKIEESLKESEEKYTTLSNSIEIGVVLHAPDTSILLSNPKASEILGLSPDQMRGKKAFDPEWKFVRQDESEMPFEEFPINKVLSTKKISLNYVAGIRRPDRNYITWVNVNAVPVLNKNKSIKYASISFVDITESKRAEKKLEKQQYYLSKAQEIGAIGTWELDLLKNELIWTDQSYRNFGVPIGTPLTYEIFLECIHPEDRDYVHAEWMAALDGKPYDIEHRLIVDGKVRWVREKADVEFDNNKKAIKAIGFTQDITNFKNAEVALQASEEKYRSLIETTDDLIYLVDKKYSYIFMNKKHAERFNLPFKKLIGRPYSDFHSKKESDFFRKAVNKVIRTGHSLTLEHKSDRDDKFYLRTFSPVKSEKGDVIAVNVISKDISELKQIEVKLIKSEQEIHKFAEYLQTAREKERELVASELHDEVGQALTGLKMDIFIIKDNMSKEKKEIPSEFQRMEKLLEDSIQKLRKIYSDLRPTLVEHFGIGEAMRQYVNDFQEQSGTKCTFYQDPEEIVLNENCSMALYRILQGAINNIKWYSLATKVNIRLVAKGQKLKLTVRDNGKGITEDQINNGESFGLIGMRERARFLGGEFEIKGIPDKGTTIKLEIPIKQNNQ